MINNLDLNVTGEIILRTVLISLFLTISINAIESLLQNIDEFLERRHIENKSRFREKETILIETKDDLKEEEFNKLSKDMKYRHDMMKFYKKTGRVISKLVTLMKLMYTIPWLVVAINFLRVVYIMISR